LQAAFLVLAPSIAPCRKANKGSSRARDQCGKPLPTAKTFSICTVTGYAIKRLQRELA
jgi:hypothetical protein